MKAGRSAQKCAVCVRMWTPPASAERGIDYCCSKACRKVYIDVIARDSQEAARVG